MASQETNHIEQSEDGKWQVVGNDGTVIASGLSNCEAWRIVDRISREPISRQEDVADWVARKEASQ